MDWIQNFDLGRWWKASIAVGLGIMLAALAANNRDVITVGFGIVALGFGEWMNHRMEMEFVNGGTLTSFHRHNRPIGLVLDGVGIILAATGLLRLIAS